MPRHCYNPKTKHHQITRTSFNDSTMAWQKSPQGNQWFIMVGPSLGVSTMISLLELDLLLEWHEFVGVVVELLWSIWIDLECVLIEKSVDHTNIINIVVSIRYNSNLKIFNNSNSPPILQPKNGLYHDRIPTLNHLVNTELLDERHPGWSPLPIVPSHSKPSMMTVDTARWWQGEVGCFWVKSCSLTWKTAMILWLKTYVNSTWQRKIVTPSCKHNFIYSIFIVKCCWIFHCDGIKSWHTQRNFDIEHEAGRYLFQLERDEKELSRNNHPCVGLLNSFTISQKQVMMAQNPPVFLAAIHHINCRCPSVQQETMALR